MVIAGFELGIARFSQSAPFKSPGDIDFNIFFLANYGHERITYGDGGSCPGLSTDLGEGCTISEDCSTITCNMKFADDHQITFKLKVEIIFPCSNYKLRGLSRLCS